MSQVQLPEQITSDSIKNYKQNVNYLPADMERPVELYSSLDKNWN